ncbi:TenA family transcriptional regulator [Gracilibacillus halophilus YIM-C55.5]|uniref:Aminopyrimidine aminohydrolase n=1 Tax=Gracilibacillus halophilus YIM-C55.5 TaxID=1308866 RepID=N4W9M4_9BACI|nr:thiaminase II [Gracilibacillus halophilus]ENH95964.1 TenA family transcriptional regulator [Gracilibacillus halophilus YIM-C55.5]
MKFSERLHQKLQPIWRQNHAHPFVKEMGEGTLDKEAFRFFMVQDYLYLIEYSKLFALGAVKAENVQQMETFASLLHSTMNEEMALHRQYAKKFDITHDELENAQPSPITLAYTRYMLYEAQNGTIAELVAALLPCMWSYWEIGKELNEIPGAAKHDLYGEWIQMYSSEEFGQLATWCIDLLDQAAEGKSEPELYKLEEIFLNTTRYEFMFWDMAYYQQMWPMDQSFDGKKR